MLCWLATEEGREQLACLLAWKVVERCKGRLRWALGWASQTDELTETSVPRERTPRAKRRVLRGRRRKRRKRRKRRRTS